MQLTLAPMAPLCLSVWKRSALLSRSLLTLSKGDKEKLPGSSQKLFDDPMNSSHFFCLFFLSSPLPPLLPPSPLSKSPTFLFLLRAWWVSFESFNLSNYAIPSQSPGDQTLKVEGRPWLLRPKRQALMSQRSLKVGTHLVSNTLSVLGHQGVGWEQEEWGGGIKIVGTEPRLASMKTRLQALYVAKPQHHQGGSLHLPRV